MSLRAELADRLERELGTDELPGMWRLPAADVRIIIAALRGAPSEAEQAFHRPTWKAALTLAHNLCAQYSNRHNDNDETEQADALNEMCGHIKPYLDCTDEEIAEMVAEANPSRYVNSSDSSGDPQR